MEMKVITKKELQEKLETRLVQPISRGILIVFIVLCSTPIVWIWFGWDQFWRIALSIVILLFDFFIMRSITKFAIEEFIIAQTVKESRKSFQDRLKEEAEKKKGENDDQKG